MLWLYLLGLVTVLSIVLRRVLRRQAPLNDELYSKTVAVDYVQSGVAWVRADGTFGSVNQSFARTFQLIPRDLMGKEWYKMFPPERHAEVREAYRQMLLAGVYTFQGPGVTATGAEVWLSVRLVAAHDRNMRLVGHHCLIEDLTKERELEGRLSAVTEQP